MPDFSTIEGCRYEAIGQDAANSRGTTLAAGGTANTKGVWAVLSSSTPIAADAIMFVAQRSGTASCDFLIDIGVGGAGSEVVLASNILVSGPGSGGSVFGETFCIPISIPAGTRLTARCQATTLSANIRVLAALVQLPLASSAGLGIVTTYGAATADSGGTSIDPGGTANIKGAWTQIVSPTAHDTKAIVAAFGNQINAARTDCTWLVDIGVGAAAAEQVLIADLLLQAAASSDAVSPTFTPPFPVCVPALSRLSVRAQCSITDATDRLFDAVLYLVS